MKINVNSEMLRSNFSKNQKQKKDDKLLPKQKIIKSAIGLYSQ